MEEESGEAFSHYTPQHPLPEEIKKLTRDKTVCKYCGVSYLIHNEIKALEEKLKVAEKELFNLRGLEKREALLNQEIVMMKQQLEEAHMTVDANTKLISTLNREINEVREKNKALDEALQLYRNKQIANLRQLSKLKQSAKQWKDNLKAIKENFTSNQSGILECMATALQNIRLIPECSAKEVSGLESKVQCLEMEQLVVTQSNKAMTETLKIKDSEIKKKNEELQEKDFALNEQRLEFSKLEASMHEASEKLISLKNAEITLNECQNQVRIMTVELDQYKLHLKTKTSEINDLSNKQKQQELAIQKLNQEIKNKENDLGTYLKQVKTLENQCREYQRKEMESAQSNKLNANEVHELKEELQRVKGDVAALKSEREMMIEAHQNRIEDLRESFKNKMAEAENWPQKLHDAVAAERGRHLAEMKTLEENLKHQFVMELQIEKDKYGELMKKFQDQEKEKTNSKENQRALLEQKYKEDIEDLHRQVTECKRRGQEREEELNKEIASLKKIIKDLQDRSAKLDGSDSGKITDLQNQLAKIHQQLIDAQSSVTLLENRLKEAKDEAQFLQGIVRKECEERFELTEALSEARKELLQLKKPPGGYSSMQKRGSVQSTHSSPSPAPLSDVSDPAMLKSKPPLPPNSINLSYSGDSRTNSSHDKNSDVQLMEARKRISNMMGRT
ncbi:unnamed protein product [Lymnaea stagnalis]|uniref:Leucine-, glutamate- and lysine-rich protein 1 n=1 Tax=Lymnaea stagnalis TaxID=6523 RepID=A0AAV2HCL5_LYMST